MSFFLSREERALKNAIKANASPISLLKCMQDVMEADCKREGDSPLFTKALYLYRTQETNATTRITGLAGLVLDYGPDNHYSRSVLASLRGEANEFHHAFDGSYNDHQRFGFRLFFNLFKQAEAKQTRDTLAPLAAELIHAFDKGEAISDAYTLARHHHKPAYGYLVQHSEVLALKNSPTHAIPVIRSGVDNSPSDPTLARVAVANIISSYHPNLKKMTSAEWMMDNALWALECPAETGSAQADGQEHIAQLMADEWLPAYVNEHGIAKAAPFAERLYELAPDIDIKKTVCTLMAPRLDLLAAEPEQLGPAAAWAMHIGANTPEVIAFTTHNLARLFKEQAEEARFKTLISYVAPEVLNRFAESLPTAERDAFGYICPRQGAFKITV